MAELYTAPTRTHPVAAARPRALGQPRAGAIVRPPGAGSLCCGTLGMEVQMRRNMSEAQGRVAISLLLAVLIIQLLQGRDPWGGAAIAAVIFVVAFVAVTFLSAALAAWRLGPLPER